MSCSEQILNDDFHEVTLNNLEVLWSLLSNNYSFRCPFPIGESLHRPGCNWPELFVLQKMNKNFLNQVTNFQSWKFYWAKPENKKTVREKKKKRERFASLTLKTVLRGSREKQRYRNGRRVFMRVEFVSGLLYMVYRTQFFFCKSSFFFNILTHICRSDYKRKAVLFLLLLASPSRRSVLRTGLVGKTVCNDL